MKIYVECMGIEDAKMVNDICNDCKGVTNVDMWEMSPGYIVAIDTDCFMMNNIGNNMFFVVGSVTDTVSFTLNYLNYESLKIV